MNLGIHDKKNDDDSESETDEVSMDEPDVSIHERQEIPMPELSPGSEYLVAFLHSAGTASATGMGLTGLSWMEIDAWVRCCDMQDIVTSRDLQTISTLSKAYVREHYASSKKGAKPPYVPELDLEEEEVRAVIEAKVDDVFANFIAAQKRG